MARAERPYRDEGFDASMEGRRKEKPNVVVADGGVGS